MRGSQKQSSQDTLANTAQTFKRQPENQLFDVHIVNGQGDSINPEDRVGGIIKEEDDLRRSRSKVFDDCLQKLNELGFEVQEVVERPVTITQPSIVPEYYDFESNISFGRGAMLSPILPLQTGKFSQGSESPLTDNWEGKTMQKIKSLKQSMMRFREEIDELKTAVGSVLTDFKKQWTQNNEMLLKTIETVHVNLVHKIQQYKTQIEDAQKRLQKKDQEQQTILQLYNQQAFEWATKIQDLEVDLATQRLQLQKLMDERQELMKKNYDLKESQVSVQEAQSEIDELIQTKNSQSEQIQELQEKVMKLERRLKSYQRKDRDMDQVKYVLQKFYEDKFKQFTCILQRQKQKQVERVKSWHKYEVYKIRRELSSRLEQYEQMLSDNRQSLADCQAKEHKLIEILKDKQAEMQELARSKVSQESNQQHLRSVIDESSINNIQNLSKLAELQQENFYLKNRLKLRHTRRQDRRSMHSISHSSMIFSPYS